jgi:hypothetical protein
VLRIGLLIVTVLVLNAGGTWFARQIEFQIFPRHDTILNTAVMLAAVLYVLLMATPFMPAIEIGLALMMLLGAKGPLLVYPCTLLALSIAFVIGRMIPAERLCPALDWLRLHAASAMVRTLAPMGHSERLAYLDERLPARVAGAIVGHRYLTLALLLNLPGNALIGGGGGIALIAGMSRLMPFTAFVALISGAALPVPAWFFFVAR